MVLSSALDNPAGMKQEDIDQDAKKQVETVQLDSMVALKIIKHCRENQQDIVTGQLLGLDVDGCLEVTNCFPLPQANKDDETIDVTTYQLDMLRALRDVNIDHNVVGWYQSARNGSFISASFVETQADYQSKFGEKCVVLVHDVTSIERGNLAIRAFRLSKNFMKAIRNKNFTTEK
jgi:translation initiation factor 3 subunit H